MLENAPDLVALGAFCIGTNQIDLRSAATQGVAVFNAPFQNTRSVVELALAEIIALTRRLTERDRALHEVAGTSRRRCAHEVRGRTLGIVGYGNIGTQLSVVAENLGMSVVFYDTAEKLALGNARRMDTLDELLEQADVVTLHVDGRQGNAGLFGAKQFARMRQGSIFLNLSRGFVVDYGALREAIVEAAWPARRSTSSRTSPSARATRSTPSCAACRTSSSRRTSAARRRRRRRRSGSSCPPSCATTSPPARRRSASTCPTSRFRADDGHHAHHAPAPQHPRRPRRRQRDPRRARDEHRGQLLATRGEIGYVVTDVGSRVEPAVIEALAAMEQTIALRILD